MHINQPYQKDCISLITNAAAVFYNKAHKYLFSKADNFSALFRSKHLRNANVSKVVANFGLVCRKYYR